MWSRTCCYVPLAWLFFSQLTAASQQPQRPTRTWFSIVLRVVLVFALVGLTWSFWESRNLVPSQEPYEADFSNENLPKASNTSFANAGSAALVIKEVKPSASVTSSERASATTRFPHSNQETLRAWPFPAESDARNISETTSAISATSSMTKSSKIATETAYADADNSSHSIISPGFPVSIPIRPIHSDSDYTIKLDLTTRIAEPRIAFLILVHTHDTCQTAQEMIHFLHHPRHRFIIHLDAKLKFSRASAPHGANVTKLDGIVSFDEEDDDENSQRGRPRKSCDLSLALKYKNVEFASERIDVKWGTMSIMNAELTAMRTALRVGGWDYAMILCGSTWPVRTAATMSRFIATHFARDSNMVFIGGTPQSCPEPVGENDCARFHDFCADNECRRRYDIPANLTIYKDFQNLILARSFVDYLVNDASMERAWKPLFRHIFAPEESMPHTVLMHHPAFRESVRWQEEAKGLEWEGLVYQKWGGTTCKSHFNPRPCCSPCYLGVNDWDDLVRERRLEKAFFMRKVHRDDPVKYYMMFHALDEERAAQGGQRAAALTQQSL